MNRIIALCGSVLLASATAQAGIHTWTVNEVFTNHNGTIQYIELFDAGNGGTETGMGSSNVSSNTQSHAWTGSIAPPTNGKFFLIATPGFAALPGAPTPDVVIPVGKVPFFDGASDTIAIVPDSCAVTAAPVDGVNAFDCATSGSVANSPTNYAGATGSIDAGGPLPAPALSPAMLGVMTTLLVLVTGGLLRGRPKTA